MDRVNEAIELLIKAIEILQNTNSVKQTKSIAKDSKLIHKDTKLIEKLIRIQKANNSNTNFLENILNNGYDTLTDGQYQIVVKICNDLNVAPDEY